MDGISPITVERNQLIHAIIESRECLEFLQGLFLPVPAELLSNANLAETAAWAQQHTSLRLLEEWIDLNKARSDAANIGLTSFVDRLAQSGAPKEQWLNIFLKQMFNLWLTWRYIEAPELGRFRAQHQMELVEEFRRLDSWQWRRASTRIAERLVQKRPAPTAGMYPRSEPAILMKEAGKRRRFRPLRRLFADLPNLLPALKPCMLMSPLAVAQVLGESTILFDVVIFDEASQILPADAIGAIRRGRQLVVVGDQHQLPPTRFFSVDPTIGDEETDEELPESILDSCMAAGMPIKPLLWHYRSRHEDLIAFSNRHFYDRKLITFPSPDANDRAIEFVYIEHGVYDRGSTKVNRIEAKWVVTHIIDHVMQYPDQSLGVITFSEAQMVAIQTELEQRKRYQPKLEALLREEGPEGFFIKNLENVQGDERDVILFSVGYGPDQAGNMTMNFGPLNRQGGERRLNVAVTRARDRVVVFASFRPHAIDRSRTQAKGVHLLRSYLEFAEQGPKALLGEITAEGGDPDSPFEEAVADALTKCGLRVVSQVGVGAFRIDLGIKDDTSDRYILGIECDGATYHSSKTARDRDRLRQEVLENLGWRIHRIWSTDWLKDPKHEIEKVMVALDHARAGGSTRKSQREAPGEAEIDQSTPESEPEALSMTSASHASRLLYLVSPPKPEIQTSQITLEERPIAQTYITADLPFQGDLDDFQSATPVALRRLVKTVVDVEGPVHEDRVIRAIATSYCISRIGRRVREQLVDTIRETAQLTWVERRGQFLWPYGMQEPPIRSTNSVGDTRPILEVPPEEIEAAISAFVEQAFSMGRDDLIAAVARELGYDRTGQHVAAAVGDAVERLSKKGDLIETGGQIRRSA